MIESLIEVPYVLLAPLVTKNYSLDEDIYSHDQVNIFTVHLSISPYERMKSI